MRSERACAAAERYREAMRHLDPGLERYDLLACGVAGTGAGFASVRETTADRRANGLPRPRRTVTVASDGRDEWLRVENVPVVHLAGPDAPLDDEVVERQLRATLGVADRR